MKKRIQAGILTSFDRGLTSHIQSWPHWWQPIMTIATYLGEPITVLFWAAIVVVVAWHKKHMPIVRAEVAAAIAIGLNSILKTFIHRTRPDTIYVTHMRFKSFSFPSGHAFGSMVVYGLLAYIVIKYIPGPWSIVISLILAALIILIGLSRVYLGAHFPTDVLGGWLLGAVALILIIIFIKP